MDQLANIKSIVDYSFGHDVEMLSGVNELFELELAFLEYNSLPKNKLLERTAYIKSVGNNLSLHYLLYSESANSLTENRSAITQSYFEKGRFSTGYATHGLFPYRGKFHPQLIKALLNIIGIQKGDILLDPMAGSGTTNIEAALLGIDTIAIDVSPFCQFMIEVKYEALKIESASLSLLKNNSNELFQFFSQENILIKILQFHQKERVLYKLAYLAYLDALGYSKRVIRSNHFLLFKKVLNRYIDTLEQILNNTYFKQIELGNLKILQDSDALIMKMDNSSVDGIITSPPYSFAIDYIENDKPQLELLGYDTKLLRERLIGLKGKTKSEKLDQYFFDMELFCREVSRVLKKDKFFVLIIGSNTNQTGGIRLEEKIIKSANNNNLRLIKSIIKPIKGMRNTMKDEYILFFKRY